MAARVPVPPGHRRRQGLLLLRVTIRVRPGSSRTAVGGTYDGQLVVRVSQRAVDGAATEAAVRAVAEAFAVRARDVVLVSGATSRTKVLDVAGATPERLAELLAKARMSP